MTKNDFPSPLHKEKQVQGHSCCRRLMVLPDAGTVERVTSQWCSSPSWERTKQSNHQRSMGQMKAEVLLHYCMRSAWLHSNNEQTLPEMTRGSNYGVFDW